MDEPTRPDPRLDGPVVQIEAQDGPVHAIVASLSSTRVPAWFTGSGEICRMREVSASALAWWLGVEPLGRPPSEGMCRHSNMVI
jgi:hypothetical protein